MDGVNAEPDNREELPVEVTKEEMVELEKAWGGNPLGDFFKPPWKLKEEPDSGRDERVEEIAKAFHTAYERLAPQYDYVTRIESSVPWDEVPKPNRLLMMAVVREVIEPRLTALEEENEDLKEANRILKLPRTPTSEDTEGEGDNE